MSLPQEGVSLAASTNSVMRAAHYLETLMKTLLLPLVFAFLAASLRVAAQEPVP
jgi:hypothetical protein